MAQADAARPSLYTPSFRLLCLTSFLGFSGQALIQPILPLLVIALGGDATLGGAVIAVFSLPSVVLRPWIGRLADAWSRRGVLVAGMAGIAASGLLYVIPSLPIIFLTRIGHGIAWAAFNTGAAATLAGLVPASRRGEAAGIWSLIPGVASAIMPAVGLSLLAAWGLGAPFVAAAALGVVGLVVGLRIRDAGRSDAEAKADRERGALLDRRALPAMSIEMLWTMTQALFMVFPPLIAQERGIALDFLPAYYLAVGVVLIGGRIAASRILDRVTRRMAILAGAGLGTAALLVGAAADDVLLLTLAGCLYAAGSAAVVPASLAMVLDATAGSRAGAAMATYSLGHQVGLGGGALLAGVLIDNLGSGVAFLAAIGATVAVAVLALRVPVARGPATVAA